jgi:hypothetical protein
MRVDAEERVSRFDTPSGVHLPVKRHFSAVVGGISFVVGEYRYQHDDTGWARQDGRRLRFNRSQVTIKTEEPSYVERNVPGPLRAIPDLVVSQLLGTESGVAEHPCFQHGIGTQRVSHQLSVNAYLLA